MTHIRQLSRSPLRLLAFLLLPTLCGTLLCISAAARASVTRQAEALAEHYTLTAVADPRIADLLDNSPGADDDPFLLWTERKAFLRAAEAEAARSPYVIREDRRMSFAVCMPEGMNDPVLSGDEDWRGYNSAFDSPYNLAILAVTCDEQLSYSESQFGDKLYPDYQISMTVNECLLLPGNCTIPSNLILLGQGYLNEEGEVPFAEGRSYLISGVFSQSIPYQDFNGTWVTDGQSTLSIGTFGASLDGRIARDGESYRIMLQHPNAPFYAELPAGMTVADYLASEAGRVWYENTLRKCELTLRSVPVISTACLNSMVWFNTGEASVLEGRAFTPEEYASGARVCLIGADYARRNGISVGSVLPLSFYMPSWFDLGGAYSEDELLCDSFSIGPYSDSRRPRAAEDFTVVGLYQTPGFRFSNHAFSPNTVFIPTGATDTQGLWDAENTDSGPAIWLLLRSFVLRTDTTEAFEAEMKSRGFEDCFLYFDQGYASAKSSVDTMIQSASRLLLLSSCLFLGAALVFGFLFARWCRKPTIIMRLLGVRANRVLLSMLGALGALAALGTLLGGLLGSLLFQCVAVVLPDIAYVSYSMIDVLPTLAAELALLLLFGFLFALPMCMQAPIKLLNKEG